jgi:hypothetical protein
MFFSHEPDQNNDEQSKIYLDFMRYLDEEKNLEDMIKDEVLDIFVDQHGIFHYYISDKTKNLLGDSVMKHFKPSFATFADMLQLRGLSINRYNRYKTMLRRKSL